MDVYSFGMIMWELWNETVPFDGDLSLCKQMILREEKRPFL